MLKVTLLNVSPNPEKIVAAAAKLCYSDSPASDIMDGLTDEKTEKFLDMLSSLGHDSPTEHVSFTFAIEGVSRSLLAQLTRHRIASYSVKSQRYVEEGSFEYITPPQIAENEEAVKIYQKSMDDALKAYTELTEILKVKNTEEFIAQGKDEKEAKRLAAKKSIEDARYVLPNACETKLVATFNTRSLNNFFEHRLCNRAQWEIRELAHRMYLLVREAAPSLFKKSGPPCAFGACPEGQMSCGKMAEKRAIYAQGR